MIGMQVRLVFFIGMFLVAARVDATDFGTAYDLPIQQNRNVNLAASATAVGDVNGDGRNDVFLIVQGFGSEDRSLDFVAYVYEQQPDGTMREASRFSLVQNGNVAYDTYVAGLSDIDGDGKAELLLCAADESIAILKRQLDGSFARQKSIRTHFKPSRIVLTDLDGDGISELLAFRSAWGLAIYKGKGGFEFDAPVSVQMLHSNDFELTDWNGDGLRDIISVAYDYGGVGIGIGYSPDPSGYVGGRAPDRYGYFRSPRHHDGVPAGAASVGNFGRSAPHSLYTLTTELEQIDAHTVHLWQTITVYGPDGNRGWREVYKRRFTDVGSVMQSPFRVQDLDADGLDDVVVFRSDRVEILPQGPQGFETLIVPKDDKPAYVNPPGYSYTHIADLNGDGCLDLGYLSRSYTIHYRTDCPASANGLRRLRPGIAPPDRPRPLRPGRGSRVPR